VTCLYAVKPTSPENGHGNINIQYGTDIIIHKPIACRLSGGIIRETQGTCELS
jgi:hypothetical protein